MDEEVKTKRQRRTVEERIAEIDAKIAALEAKKEKLTRPAKMKDILAKAAESGMTLEEIAEKLGL